MNVYFIKVLEKCNVIHLRHDDYHYVQYEVLWKILFSSLLVVGLLIHCKNVFSRIKIIYLYVLITIPIGFDIVFTNVEATLK